MPLEIQPKLDYNINAVVEWYASSEPRRRDALESEMALKRSNSRYDPADSSDERADFTVANEARKALYTQWLMQSARLVYREVGDRIFVTNPERRQVIVLNRAGFRVLALCHGRTLGSVRDSLDGNEASIDDEGLESFVRSLQAHGLVAIRTDPSMAETKA